MPVTLIVLADRNGWKEGHPILERNFKEMVQAGTMAQDQHHRLLDACISLYGSNEEKQMAFAVKNSGHGNY